MPTARSRKNKQAAPASLGRRLIVPGLLVAVLVVVAVYLLVSMMGGEEATAQPGVAGAPPISFEPGQIDFGEMPPATVHSRTVLLRNTGSTPLRILASRTSCTCLQTDLGPTTLQPGAGTQMTVSINSLTTPGFGTYTANLVVDGYAQPAMLSVQRTTLAE